MSTITARPGTAEWLIEAAQNLEAEGDFSLAAEARAEAAEMAQPKPVPAPVVVRCDYCHRPVGKKQAAKYGDDMNLDWALCTACEKRDL